jgi:hypothetical protein
MFGGRNNALAVDANGRRRANTIRERMGDNQIVIFVAFCGRELLGVVDDGKCAQCI